MEQLCKRNSDNPGKLKVARRSRARPRAARSPEHGEHESGFKEWRRRTVHISPAPGKAEGRKPGINIKLPREPDVSGRNTIAEAAAAMSSASRAGAGEGGRTALVWGLLDPSLVPEQASLSFGQCSHPILLSGAPRNGHCHL